LGAYSQASSMILIITHVGSAVVLVLTGFALLERTIGNAGRAPMLEHASHVLILLLGLWLFIRAVRPHRHDDERSGFALAFVTGMIPCPLTTFIMTYARWRGGCRAHSESNLCRRHDRDGRSISAAGRRIMDLGFARGTGF